MKPGCFSKMEDDVKRILFLLVNSVCDLSCRYCFYTLEHQKRSKERILPSMMEMCAERIANANFGTVILTGGDPLCKRFKHETYILIKTLKSHNLKVIINTSAAGMDEMDIDILLSLGIDRVDVSIDSYDPNVHNFNRGCHAEAVRVIENFIKRNYLSVTTTTVVTKESAASLMQTIEWLYSLGVKDIRIQRAFILGESVEGAGLIQSEMRRAVEFLISSHIPHYIDLTERTWRGQLPPSSARCCMGEKYFVCGSGGILTPCFHRQDIILGNLFFDPLDYLEVSMKKYLLADEVIPQCFGKQCVSLFDNKHFWRDGL